MTYYAVKLTREDGSCAIFGTPKGTPIVVEIAESSPFPEGHVAAMAKASEITGLPLDGGIVFGTSVEPVEYVLDQMMAST